MVGLNMRSCAFRASLLATVSVLSFSGAAFAAEDNSPTLVDTVVVTAPREEVVARLRQAQSATIINVQSAETITKYPDYNAAEAAGRIPGVSLSTDTGEGRFINIRGIDANLNGATYGGVVLLNTYPAGTAASGSGRAVEFDTIPTGAIDGIVLYKTLSPDREAEGLGGQIDLTPRSAKNITKPFVEAELGWGYEPLHDHTGPATGSIALGARFGFVNGKLVVAGVDSDLPTGAGWLTNPTPFSIVLTASRKDDRRSIDDIEPSYANDGATAVDNVLGEVDFRKYDYHRRRFGYGGEVDFQPNDNHSYYFRFDEAGYVEAVHKQHFYAVLDGGPVADPASLNGGVIDTFRPRIFTDDSQETHRNIVITAGGKDEFGAVVVDYHVAYSRASYVENYYREARWNGPKGLFVAYNNLTNTDGLYKFYTDAGLTNPFNPQNPTVYNNPRLRQFYEADRDEEYSGVFNVTAPLHIVGENGQVKFGASVRERGKVVTDFFAQATPTANLATYSTGANPCCDYYGGLYIPAPVVDLHAQNALFAANITSLDPSLGRDFNDSENVYAGYLMYTTNFGKLSMLSGVRVEHTEATYGNYLSTTDASGNATTSFVNHGHSYTNVFPTVQFKYAANDRLQMRLTYSTGIARPGFSQAGGFAGVDFSTSPRPVYTAGNPNLKPTTGNNFDADIEYYMPNGGIIQVGLFDKEFQNYIFKHTRIQVADPIFQGQLGDFASFANEGAYARGLEMAYHQKFAMLPGLFSGLGLDANITLVKSSFLEYDASVSADGKNHYGSLPGTSNLTWNLSGFYEARGLELRLSTEYVSHSLFGLNGDPSLDTIQDNKLNLDFTSSYHVNRIWSAYFNVKNLLNTPLRYYEGSTNRPIQREVYGQTYEFGVRAHF